MSKENLRLCDVLVGLREKTDQISLGEAGRIFGSYAMILAFGARRGVNKTALKWDKPCCCLVTNILDSETGNIGVGLASRLKVTGFPKIC